MSDQCKLIFTANRKNVKTGKKKKKLNSWVQFQCASDEYTQRF